MFLYARWNARGLTGGLRLLDVIPSPLSPISEIPERDFRDAPLPAPVFEGDVARLALRLDSADGRARGPARFTAAVGEIALEAGTGPVPPGGGSHGRPGAGRGRLVAGGSGRRGRGVLALPLARAPASPAVADQLARLAASEAWDCYRAGGRVLAWSPGLEPLAPWQARSIWAVLEWLARWPELPAEQVELPRAMEALPLRACPAGPALEGVKELRDRRAA